LSRLKITADDALKIADDNGGKSFRLASANQCQISMILAPDSDTGWDIGFDDNHGRNFNIHIDPYTGKVIHWVFP